MKYFVTLIGFCLPPAFVWIAGYDPFTRSVYNAFADLYGLIIAGFAWNYPGWKK